MNRRRHPPVVRAVEGFRGAVRNAITALRSVSRPTVRSTEEPRPDDSAVRRRAADRELTADSAIVPATANDSGSRATDCGTPAALVDPDGGPTSRSEVLEYGVSPAEYVRAVVAEHGGRMKQRRFVDEYGWSASTVSRLLSELEDGGAIDRYRVGREKVVAVPGATAVDLE